MFCIASHVHVLQGFDLLIPPFLGEFWGQRLWSCSGSIMEASCYKNTPVNPMSTSTTPLHRTKKSEVDTEFV